MSDYGRRRMESRFSLVELLVVIAIISLLMSLLLPALSKVKEKGIQLACMNNMKQVGMGVVSYAQDHNDWLVQYYPRFGYLWRMALNLNNYIGDGKVLICPAERKIVSWGGSSTNYAYNKKIGNYQCWGTDPTYLPLMWARVSQPSVCVLLNDGQPVAADYYEGFDDHPWWGDPTNRRHSSGMNALFADGHAAWCVPAVNSTQACGYWWGRPK